MYGNKLAAAIKVNGKVLREFKDTVYIPFGSEYTILIKNLESRRAVVNVFLDGENAVPNGLILDAFQEIELERRIVNGNLTEGNRFKFIERTENIENGPRGIKLEDGLIRIVHQFEVLRPIIHSTYVAPTWTSHPWSRPSEFQYTTDKFTLTASGAVSQTNINGSLRGVDYSAGESMKASATAATNATLRSMNVSPASGAFSEGMATMDSYCDTGITVPGSKSTQSFKTATVGALESSIHTMVIKLLGDLGNNKPVTKPVTVKHKPKCVTCGKQNKAHAKFCTECGTALEIFA